jgi:uncharacterized protein (TIGR02266 family)
VPALPVVRLRLKYVEIDTFVDRFAPNVTRGGIFLASREPRPVGTEVRFEVQLMNGPPVLSGEGRVTWVKAFNPAEPQRAHGMGVQFTTIDPACRPVLDRLLRKREEAQRRGPAPAPPPPREPAASPARLTDTRTASTIGVVELGFEDIEDTALRRILERARALSARTEDVEELRKPEPEEPATVAQALGELSRYINRRTTGSGLVRLPPEPPSAGGGKRHDPT